MKTINFNDLPEAVSILLEKVSAIETILQKDQNSLQGSLGKDELFTISQAAEFLSLSVPTLYSLNCKGELPSCKRGKRLYFSKNDLSDWITSTRKKTNSELEEESLSLLIRSVAGNSGQVKSIGLAN